MTKNKRYDMEYKKQAVKLAKEIGQSKAALELGIPRGTLGRNGIKRYYIEGGVL